MEQRRATARAAPRATRSVARAARIVFFTSTLALGGALDPAPRAQAQEPVPSREDVADFFAGLRADLFACGRGWHGVLELEIVFAREGNVTGVTVHGEGAPDHATSCVSSVVRSGRIRAFTEPAAVVEHTIRL